MSNQNQANATQPNAPQSTEPHGISFTLVQPTPPNSPNLVPNFPTAQKRPSPSKLSGNKKTKVDTNSS
ncbi:hypothetical protein C8Q77DRAFT_1154330 [Trametes polyzona]|nr:hypothetical protein C8Q77DRAFT_1154330 [Trametes polyzona]